MRIPNFTLIVFALFFSTQFLKAGYAAESSGEYTLFDQGRTAYRIIIGGNASESERWAAQELRHWLREISGADFVIMEDSVAPNGPEIVLGVNRHTHEILQENNLQIEPGDEGFTIRSAGPHLLIYGGNERGTMYGVMDFLESELGCRWYTPTVSAIPKKDRWQFTQLNRSDAPALPVRNDFYYEAFDPIWAARNRINGAMTFREQPGGVEGYWGVHTFYFFIPPKEFFDEHPEYFSLIDGKRIHDHAQLCLTNPEVMRIIIERLTKFMRENPQYLIYDVSQNDWRQPCQCDDCQAIAEQEGSESGPMLNFVNQVAQAIEGEFPDKYVGTLAYQYTRKAPTTLKPRKNVVVRLCSIECCFSHSFDDCPENQSFLQDLKEWAEIAPQLYIWDYVVNFSHYVMPHPNLKVLQPNLQAFLNNKSIGVMEQACYNTRGGELSELRAYLLAKLLWNPNRTDVDATIDDFMFGYYGRSGQYIKQYLDWMHDRITPDTHFYIFDGINRTLYDGDFIETADSIFDKAESIADDPRILHRVELARLPLIYLKVRKNPSLAIQDGTYARLKEICIRENVTRLNEQQAIEEFFKKIEGEI